MKLISSEELTNKDHYLLFIHSPFCGTCHVARKFLDQIELTLEKEIFYEMNAALNSEFMLQQKIESVPCLLIVDKTEIKEKIYTFYSIQNIYHYLLEYAPYLFRA